MSPQSVYNLIAYMVRVTADDIARHLRCSRQEVSAALCVLMEESAIEPIRIRGERYYTPT